MLSLLMSVSLSWGMVLVENGKPGGVIIVALDAPDSVQYAARELQSYLQEVSGATLTIAHTPSNTLCNIFIGESEFTKTLGLSTAGLKSDGFKIITGENFLAIFGRDYAGPPIYGLRVPWRYIDVYNEKLKLGAFGETGTLFGVYHFLEKFCGVRWYMPGELGTVIPQKTTLLTEAITLEKSPDYEYRYPWLCYFATADQDAQWYRRVGFGAAYPAQIIDSFQFFLKYKDSHPEYFALIDGQRDFTNRSCVVGGGNLCLANPQVAEQWIADINDYFDKNPQQFIFPLSPNDGMVKICECQDCQAQIDKELGNTGEFSNYVWTFIDKVARGVAIKHPDKFVGGIAYANYNMPPTRIPRLSPNVAVMICKSRGWYVDKAYCEKIHETMAGWQAKTVNIYFWEYYLYSRMPWRGLPVFYPHMIAEELKSLQGISKGEFFDCGSFADDPPQPTTINYPGLQHLNMYVTAKLYWDADLNIDNLLDEYYEKFYGPARDSMKAFWTTAEEIWLTRGAEKSPVKVYRQEELNRLSSCLEQAMAQTPEHSVYRQRVELIQSEFIPARRKLMNPLVLNPPHLQIPGPAASMQINGLIDEQEWQNSTPVTFVDKNGETASYETKLYASWDEENLYLALLNYEPEIGNLVARASQRDDNDSPGIWGDDAVEIFICPDPNHREICYQYVVNTKGMVWDGAYGLSGTSGADIHWNSSCEAQTKIESDRWVVEIRIPLKEMGIVSPVGGKTLAANVYRDRYCGKPAVHGCLSPTLAYGHFTTDRFGTITFTKKQ